MPTIPKLQKKTSDRRAHRNRTYQDTEYRKTRLTYMQMRPLCEDCVQQYEEGEIEVSEIKLSTDLHHVISPFNSNLSKEQSLYLLRNPDNFKALCKKHHEERHTDKKDKKNIWKEFIFSINNIFIYKREYKDEYIITIFHCNFKSAVGSSRIDNFIFDCRIIYKDKERRK